MIPTTAEVMDELREVTVQYTSCADPTETLARKQRVLQGEARGFMAETTEQIIATASIQIQTIDPPIMEQALEPSSGAIEEILPVSQLLEGTALEPTILKKKRGRPPLTKPINKSPILLSRAKSSKRNKVLVHKSPKR